MKIRDPSFISENLGQFSYFLLLCLHSVFKNVYSTFEFNQGNANGC